MPTKYIVGDIHTVIKDLPTASVDLIYTNPPFGITQCVWDKPLKWSTEFWHDIWRVVKPRGIVVLHASGKFADVLTKSDTLNCKRYELVWVKNRITGHLFAKHQPLRQTERIFVFYKHAGGTYNPQMTGDKVLATKHGKPNAYYLRKSREPEPDSHHVGHYPRDLLHFPVHIRGGKTVCDDLIEYVVKTYSNEHDTILDMSCHNTVVGDVVHRLRRSYIGVDVVRPDSVAKTCDGGDTQCPDF